LCVISNYWISFYILTNYRALPYVISQNNGCHCFLSHKLRDVFVTNYWTSFYVTSQTAGCHYLLPHKLLDVLFYLTNC